MYNCPNCSGNLSFDIASQQLMCEYCKTRLDPYEYEKTQDAEENDMFGVTVFTCPQCGGEIMTTNVTAAGFCTYCGASTILDSRMKNEKRPTHIIPFRLTKEDCRKSYSSLVRRALFAPRQLRDPEYLERFRGIYIPYWVYGYRMNGSLRLQGTKHYRRGDYKITDYYRLGGQVDAQYKGITFDASSSFDDTVAESIAPFEAAKMQPFTPSILCGFYADAPDVDNNVYREDAYETVCEDAQDRLSGVKEYQDAGVELPQGEKFREQFGSSGMNITADTPVCAYLPVWFLTYRKNDRVAYAVMNGCSGKITADLPIDEVKYLLGSLLLALPIFALLAFFLTMTGRTVLLFSSVLALISLFIYTWETGAVSDKETHSEDKGFLYSSGRDGNHEKGTPQKKRGMNAEEKSSLLQKVWSLGIPLAVLAVLVIRPAWKYLSDSGTISLSEIYGVVSVFILIASLFFINAFAESEGARKGIFLHTAGSVLAVLAAAAVLVWNPVNDIWYYSGSLLAAAGVCLTFIGIIRKYNMFATRPLPTFYDRKGGSDRAR